MKLYEMMRITTRRLNISYVEPEDNREFLLIIFGKPALK